jgi:uncharacterized lipoprotein YmbA
MDMKTWNRLVFGLVCSCALLTAGCVKLWQDNLDIKTYVIEAPRNLQPLDQPLADKLWIDSVVVLPPYNVRNLILRENDVKYSTSYYTELLMSPSENFRNAFYVWFAESGIFSDVTLAERSGMSHRLVVSVLNFHGDVAAQKAVLKIKATLFDEKTKGMAVLFTKGYQQEVKVVGSDAEELIRAYNMGLAKILADCERDVIGALQ